MAFAYDPKTSGVTVEYKGLKENNEFYWVTQKAWNAGYLSQTLQTISPKGTVVYTDGTAPTEPTK